MVPRIIFLPVGQISHNEVLGGLVKELSEQFVAVFMPGAGTNSSRAAGVQFRLTFNDSEYWPTGQRSQQASSSGLVQLNLNCILWYPWPSPFESGSMLTFKWDPALQQRTRE